MPTLAEKAAATAAKLDKVEPGWAERISLDNLDIAFPSFCVIGQLRGSFWFADVTDLGGSAYKAGDQDASNARLEWGQEAGLVAHDHPTIEAMNAEYAELTRIWTGLVKERLAA